MFHDTGETVYGFFYNYDKLLECPECLHCIKLRKDSSILNCYNCGFQKNLRHNGLFAALWGRNDGIVYGCKLFLRTRACGHELWAFNKEHLDYLEGYISNLNRHKKPNINQSVASRMPDWMKSSRNRVKLINALKKLRRKLEKF
ncbi:hypothetical protein [Paenibacillus turpanensis]|uniref:hypothetical protein n=1 Tax=Paenibacillus turpanensis TaxID=2689078 RepID=UPI0014097D8A|nr:hypothetical protein [Paenibacillus turpanensis]